LKKTKKTALTPPSQIRMIPPHQGKTNMRLDKTTIEKNNAEMTNCQKFLQDRKSIFIKGLFLQKPICRFIFQNGNSLI